MSVSQIDPKMVGCLLASVYVPTKTPLCGITRLKTLFVIAHIPLRRTQQKRTCSR